jgi:hypothetical protein
MKNKVYYLKDGIVYYEDKKSLHFISVKNPEIKISYVAMDPDEVDTYKEIVPSPQAKPYRSAPEKLFRVLTDINTVIYLTEESFSNISRQVNNYLNDIEDYERMCILRDISIFYQEQRKKKKAQIEDYIKHFNKIKK